MEERKLNQTLLANHSTLLDLLEIPQLMDTYVTFLLPFLHSSSSFIVAESCLTVSKLMLVGAYGMGIMMRHLI